MQAVDLNLATRPFKNDTLLWAGLTLAVILLGSLSWWNVATWREHRRLLDDLRESQVNIGERFGALDQRDDDALRRVSAVDLPALVTRTEKANEVIRWKAFSWTRLFNLLQEVQPWNVQMTSIHPVFRGDRRAARNAIEDLEQVPVSVEGTAKTLKDFLEFERALIFDPHFDRVEPDNTATDENSGETIFRVRFLYDPRVGQAPEIPADRIAANEGEAAAPAEEAPDLVQPAKAERADASGPAADTPSPEESGELASGNLKKIGRGGRKQQKADQIPTGVATMTDPSPDAAPPEPSPTTDGQPEDDVARAAVTLAPGTPGVDEPRTAVPPRSAEEVGAQRPESEPPDEAPPRDVRAAEAGGSERPSSVDPSRREVQTAADDDEDEEDR